MRMRRGTLPAVLALTGALVLVAAPVPSQAAGSSVVLTGSGSWGVIPHMTDWASVLYDAPRSVELNYFGRGSHDGRGQFVRGETDFVVSGVPFSDDERAALATAKRTYVSVPLAPTALVFLVRPPLRGLEEVRGTEDDPQFVPYTGPFRMPPSVIAKTIFVLGNEPWNDQEFKDAIGVTLRSYITGLVPVVRSDPSAMNLYLETYLKKVAPDIWAQKISEDQVATDAPTENWPFLETTSRAGIASVVSAVASDFRPDSGGGTQGGNMGIVTPWAAKDAHDRMPQFDLRVAEIKNGADEWVAPTPETITKAIVSGDGKPLSALTSNDSGGYPLAWLNYLYAPTTGLGPDKGQALATFIRYAVTSGRAKATTYGEAALPSSFVDAGLAAANEVVRGNCTGSDHELVNTTDPGPFSPSRGALSAVGTMLLCRLKSVVLPTVIAPPPVGPGFVSSPPISVIPNLPSVVQSRAGSGSIPAAEIKLPMAIAGTAPGRTDTPITMLVGALLYWRAYLYVGRRRRRATG